MDWCKICLLDVRCTIGLCQSITKELSVGLIMKYLYDLLEM